MAPELYISPDTPITTKCDMWSLGCVFYELMALLPPYQGNNRPYLKKIITENEVEELKGEWSEEFTDLIYKLLDKDPNKRPTAADIICMEFYQEFELGRKKTQYTLLKGRMHEEEVSETEVEEEKKSEKTSQRNESKLSKIKKKNTNSQGEDEEKEDEEEEEEEEDYYDEE